jgi:alpha-mannosidase
MAKNKNQHYIPVCYLKSFSADGRSIHVYDKSLKKNYTSSLKSIAQIDNLYDFPAQYISKGAPEGFNKFMETDF